MNKNYSIRKKCIICHSNLKLTNKIKDFPVYMGVSKKKYTEDIIVDMKKNKGPGYHIPDKFLYKYLSAPNYFGEIIEWIGWAILTWSISGVVFLIWVIANLFPRAISHHRWYKSKFEDYPKTRKAIIPGII